MLRISIIKSAADSATLLLEGHLVGAGNAELSDTCERMTEAGQALALDLDLLASLSRRGVSFVRCSPFQVEQLRQAAAVLQESTTTSP